MAKLDSNKVFSGFQFGLLVGGLVALFRAPRISIFRRGITADSLAQLKNRVNSVDPITRSISEGKEAARRRHDEINRLP